MDVSTDSRRAPTADGENDLSPLEQEVLDEYAKLVGNLDNVFYSTLDVFNEDANHVPALDRFGGPSIQAIS